MTNAMEKEFYIFGEPIDTGLGQVRFLTYKEYLMNISDLSTISMNILHIYYQYRKAFDKGNEEAMAALEELKQSKLYDFVKESKDFWNAYENVFNLVMENDAMIAQVMDDAELFMSYRDLVMDMNMLQEDEVNPNPEIQKGIEMSKKLKSNSGDKQTPTDIITSVVAGTPNSFEDVCRMTVLQVYSIFYRLGAFKTYDTETLFATVSSEVKISSWSKNIDMFAKQSSGIKKKDFDKTYGKLLN